MTRLPLTVMYYGSDQPLPERRRLRAGPLSVIFEAGDLRYIRLSEREVLRRVYVAVRDRHWGTIPLRMAALRIEEGADWFRIEYEAEHQRGDIDFVWRGALSGGSDGTIRFTMDGEARSTFLRNRIGFCVLHPIRECAGQRCMVETADGPRLDGRFPTLISPHQPFREMRAIAHEVAPGLRADVRFSGDIFEMEDQRNWSDASYKTYCTPLRLPYPVEITRGTKVLQSVTVTLNGTAAGIGAGREAEPRMITLGEASGKRLPRIGLGMASHEQCLSEAEVARLQRLNLGHLRVDLHLAQDYQATLRRAVMDAKRLDVPLEVALFVSDDADQELAQLRAACGSLAVQVRAWLVFHQQEATTGLRWLKLARQRLGSYQGGATFAGGTNLYFAEFGRARLPLSLMDAACYSITPQAHAFDHATVVENAEAIASTIESARTVSDGLPISISPVTLRPRFNANATRAERMTEPDELPSQVDPRQMSLFGAGWTLTSLKYMAETGGVESVTYYETTGWRGVMETAGGSPAPEKFQSLPGSVFPLYHVLADVGELSDGAIIPATSNDTLHVDALAIRRQGGTRVLVANLTDAAQTVAIRGLKQTLATVRQLDETCAEQAALAPEIFRAASGEVTVQGVATSAAARRQFADDGSTEWRRSDTPAR